MSERTDAETARLRAGFAARPAVAPAGHDCPDPGQIFDAASGQLTADERRSIVAAVAACGHCAEAWRLAVEVARDVTPAAVAAPVTPSEGRRPERRRSWYAPAFAAAMAAVLLIVVVVWRGRGDERAQPGELRGGEPGAVQALVPDGAALSREAFDLRWTDAEPGSRYDLTLFTAELRPVYAAPDLGDARHRVPAAALAGQAPGAVMYWRVDVRGPDGRRASSATLRVIVR